MSAMPKSRTDRLRATAYHEAGHALAHWRGRLPFRSVSIEPSKDSLGHVLSHSLRLTDDHVYEPSPRVRDRLERKIVCLLAGREAERLVSTRYNHTGASDDRRKALGLALRSVGGSLEEVAPYFQWLTARAMGLVKINRKSLDALAVALIRRRTLAGEEAVQVMLAAVLPAHLLDALPDGKPTDTLGGAR